MKQIDLPNINTPNADWQLLGELNLSVEPDDKFTINAWLAQLLIPLDLSTDFMNRVQESVQSSATRILQPKTTSLFGHIHLCIYAPYERIPERKTWGFFHIERIESQVGTANTNDRAINFYLYVEG